MTQINPEWVELGKKPHLVPAICHPDRYINNNQQHTMNQQIATQPKRRGQVEIEFQTQDHTVESLAQEICHLEDRLVNVLKPQIETPPSPPDKDDVALVPAAKQLRKTNERLAHLVSRIKSLVNRIEL